MFAWGVEKVFCNFIVSAIRVVTSSDLAFRTQASFSLLKLDCFCKAMSSKEEAAMSLKFWKQTMSSPNKTGKPVATEPTASVQQQVCCSKNRKRWERERNLWQHTLDEHEKALSGSPESAVKSAKRR